MLVLLTNNFLALQLYGVVDSVFTDREKLGETIPFGSMVKNSNSGETRSTIGSSVSPISLCKIQ